MPVACSVCFSRSFSRSRMWMSCGTILSTVPGAVTGKIAMRSLSAFGKESR